MNGFRIPQRHFLEGVAKLSYHVDYGLCSNPAKYVLQGLNHSAFKQIAEKVRAGKKSTNVLLEEWGERGVDFLKRLKGFYSSEGVGWFKIREIEVDPNKQRGYIRIEQSFIAEEYGGSDRPVCDFLSGYLQG